MCICAYLPQSICRENPRHKKCENLHLKQSWRPSYDFYWFLELLCLGCFGAVLKWSCAWYCASVSNTCSTSKFVDLGSWKPTALVLFRHTSWYYVILTLSASLHFKRQYSSFAYLWQMRIPLESFGSASVAKLPWSPTSKSMSCKLSCIQGRSQDHKRNGRLDLKKENKKGWTRLDDVWSGTCETGLGLCMFTVLDTRVQLPSEESVAV